MNIIQQEFMYPIDFLSAIQRGNKSEAYLKQSSVKREQSLYDWHDVLYAG